MSDKKLKINPVTGKLDMVGSGVSESGDLPVNLVTTNTEQQIIAEKSFSDNLLLKPKLLPDQNIASLFGEVYNILYDSGYSIMLFYFKNNQELEAALKSLLLAYKEELPDFWNLLETRNFNFWIHQLYVHDPTDSSLEKLQDVRNKVWRIKISGSTYRFILRDAKVTLTTTNDNSSYIRGFVVDENNNLITNNEFPPPPFFFEEVIAQGGYMPTLKNVTWPLLSSYPASKYYVDKRLQDFLENIEVRNVLYVSKSGLNIYAQRNSFSKMFATITGALDAAVTGDLIYVFPGTYTDNNLIRKNVYIYFEPGCVLTGNSLQQLNGANVTWCYILGWARFIKTSGFIMWLKASDTIQKLYVECDEMVNTDSNCIYLFKENIDLTVISRNGIRANFAPIHLHGGVSGKIKITTSTIELFAGPLALLNAGILVESCGIVYLEVNADEMLIKRQASGVNNWSYNGYATILCNIKKTIHSGDSHDWVLDNKWGSLTFNGDIYAENAGCYGNTYNGIDAIGIINGRLFSKNKQAVRINRPGGKLTINGHIESETQDAISITNSDTTITIKGSVKGIRGIYTNQATAQITLERAIIESIQESIFSTVPLSVKLRGESILQNIPNGNITLVEEFTRYPLPIISKWEKDIGLDEFGKQKRGIRPINFETIDYTNIDRLFDEKKHVYGYLYPWYVALLANQNGGFIAGMRVPSDTDWDQLITYLGGEETAGEVLKSSKIGPDYHPRWNAGSQPGTDLFRFTGHAGGLRSHLGYFEQLGNRASWWCSTEIPNGEFIENAFFYSLESGLNSVLKSNSHKRAGRNLRLVKDDFTSVPDGTILAEVSDYNENTYTVVKIGNQAWLGQNLAARNLASGVPISKVETNLAWSSLEGPAYCAYDNDEYLAYINTHGKIKKVAETADFKDLVNRPEAHLLRLEFGVSSSETIIAGVKGSKTISFDGEIKGWRLISDISTYTQIDLWKVNDGIPAKSNSITDQAKPLLNNNRLSSSAELTGWNTQVQKGDVITLEVEINNNARYLFLELEIVKTI